MISITSADSSKISIFWAYLRRSLSFVVPSTTFISPQHLELFTLEGSEQ